MAFRKSLFLPAFFLLVIARHPGFCDTQFPTANPLSLQDCLAVALRNQPDLLAARQNVEAHLSKAAAKTGMYWPQIALESDFLRGNFINNVAGPAQTLLTTVYTTYLTEFSGNWTLEDFGKRYSEVSEANAQLAQAEAAYHDARSSVIFEVAKAFFQVLEAQSFAKEAEDLLTASQRHAQLAESFVKVGEKPKLEWLKAQTNYFSAQYNRLKASHALENAVTRLNQAMGVANPPSYSLKEEFAVPDFHMELPEAEATAFQKRPALQISREKVREAKARENALRAKRWPVLSATGVYGWLSPTFPPGTRSWLLGTTMNWGLFDGNQLSHEIDQAAADEKKMEAEEKSAVLAVRAEVERDYRSFRDLESQWEVAKEEVKEAEEAYRLAESRYKLGLSTLLDLEDATAGFSLAKAHEVEAITGLRIAEAALKRSMGMEEP